MNPSEAHGGRKTKQHNMSSLMVMLAASLVAAHAGGIGSHFEAFIGDVVRSQKPWVIAILANKTSRLPSNRVIAGLRTPYFILTDVPAPGAATVLPTWALAPWVLLLVLADDAAAAAGAARGLEDLGDTDGPRIVLAWREAAGGEGDSLVDVFHEYWKIGLTSVVAVPLPREHSSMQSALPLLTYRPWSRDGCNSIRPVLVASWTPDQPLPSLFEPPADNLAGCPLRIVTFEYPPFIVIAEWGIEDPNAAPPRVVGSLGDVLHTLAKAMNFTIQLQRPLDGGLWGYIGTPEQTMNATGLVGDVARNSSDIGFVIIVNKPFARLVASYSSRFMCFTWCMPEGVGYRSPFAGLGFSPKLWLSVFLSLACAAATWAFVSQRRLHIAVLVLNLFATAMGVGMWVSPRTGAERVLLGPWLLAVLVVVSAYQALLGSLATSPYRDPDINSVQELDTSRLHIGGLRFLVEALYGMVEGDPVLRRLADKASLIPEDIWPTLHRLETARDMAFLCDRELCHAYSALTARPLHTLPDFCNWLQNVHAFILKRESPLRARMSDLTLRLEASGVMEKLLGVTRRPPESAPRRPLNMERLLPSLTVLALGWLAGSVAFVAEICAGCVNAVCVKYVRQPDRKRARKLMEATSAGEASQDLGSPGSLYRPPERPQALDGYKGLRSRSALSPKHTIQN